MDIIEYLKKTGRAKWLSLHDLLLATADGIADAGCQKVMLPEFSRGVDTVMSSREAA